MGIQINGATDSITAIDGTIDVVSAIGNAGVVTATAFVGNITGNVTGNINHTSNLELQTGGVTRAHFNPSGHFGIAGITTISHTGANQLTIKDSNTTGNAAEMRISFKDSGNTERFYIGNNESSNSYLYLGSPSGQNNNVALTVGGSTKLTAFSGGIGVNGDLELQDTIYHAGDTDTKIRFPAANTISFETAGSERLRIDTNGRILIGHTINQSDLHGPQGTTGRNPYFQLHGANTSSAGLGLISWKNAAGSYYAPTLYLAHSGSDTKGTNGILPANGEFGSIVFSGDDGTDFVKGAMIKARLDGTPGNDDMPGRLEFYTTPDGAQAPVERLRINQTGQVKIFGADDQDNFIVDAAGGTQFTIHQDATDGEISIRAQDGSGNNYAKYMTFFTEGGSGTTERLRITSSGEVVINNSSPIGGKLEINTGSEVNGSGDHDGQNFAINIRAARGSGLNSEGNGICFSQHWYSGSTTIKRTAAIVGIKNNAAGSYGGGLKIKYQPDGSGAMQEAYRITSKGTSIFGGNGAAPIIDNGELYYRGNSTQTFENLPQNLYLYSDDIAYDGTNPGAGMVFGGQYTSGGSYTTFAGIHAIKENTTDNQYGGALIFGVRPNGGATPWERLRIDSSGNVTKPTNFHIIVDRSSNQTGYNASNMSDVIIWNRVISGQSSTGASNHFNTSTGLFTAPVTGLYLFHVAVNCSYAVQGAWLNINGSRPNYANFYPNGAQSADAMITYKVTAGQTVGVKWYYNGQTNGTINSNALHTWWRIILLG